MSIITITNTDTSTYEGNNVALLAGETLIIDMGRGDDVRTNSSGRIRRMTTPSGFVNPFGSNAADVSQYDADGTGDTDRLLVQVWISEDAYHNKQDPSLTNR